MKQNTSVLVVDDDVVIIKIILNILNKNGYSTDVCKSGERAIEMIKNKNYDLVLLDVHLGSGMDGYRTCREILEINRDLPVILMTADNDEESINKGFLAGSSDYIRKPLSRMELLARLNKTINFNRSEKRNLQLIYDLSKDLETAAKIQTSMLPKWVYLDSEVVFSSHYEPFEAVGGDLFDRIKISDDYFVIYLGDISGHGVQAALLMTAIKSIIKIMVETDKDNLDLPWLVTRLNNRLSNELFIFDNYLTLLIGIIDIRKMEFRYLNAGHPPFVMLDTISGETTAVESVGSLPLGWMPNMEYREEDMGVIPITDHQIFLLFSDGIYECNNPKGEQFGINGVLYSLKNYIQLESCISLPYRIKQYLVDNKYNLSADDFTLFAFQKRRRPDQSEPVTIIKESQAMHFTISLQAALREVGKTAQHCEELILNWKNNPTLAAKVELIVDEFLNNIIKYGYNYSEDAAIVVEFNIQTNLLVIKFWDKGIEWCLDAEPYSVDNPYNFENELFEVDGRGVKIIMSMSNKFKRVRYGQFN
jgi:sigma-B regulation protein RsbU (phosphoserine phosphatase)